MMPLALNFDLEPKEALQYLQDKGFLTSFFYKEVLHQHHHKAFTIAKMMRADLLADTHEALLKAMREGKSFKEFKEELKPTLMRKGWWGERDIVNPTTGEVKTIHINSRRLQNIFNTNLRVARNVARHRQMSQLKTMTYWRYSAILDRQTREDHAERHGIVLHRDNPWWKTNYPPNGWGCRCTVRAYSDKQIERRGWKITKEIPENIASEDWAYDVGAGSKVATLQKLDLKKELASLPIGEKQEKYAAMSEAVLLETFFKKLKVNDGDVMIDKIGDPMIISSELFLDKKSGELKIKNNDRHLLLDYFSEVLTSPDEIYLEPAGNSWKKNMFLYFNIDGKKEAVLAVFRYFKDKTQGATLFHVTHKLEERRVGKLIYTKGQDAN